MASSCCCNKTTVSENITDFYSCMVNGSYKKLFPNYESYVNKQVDRIKQRYNGGAVLSVGCGNGDIEAALPFPVVCYDIHDAAKILHPELDFRPEWPDEKYDLVLCIGAVLPYIPYCKQKIFIKRLLNTTTENGRILMTGNHHTGDRSQNIVKEYTYPTVPISDSKIEVL